MCVSQDAKKKWCRRIRKTKDSARDRDKLRVVTLEELAKPKNFGAPPLHLRATCTKLFHPPPPPGHSRIHFHSFPFVDTIRQDEKSGKSRNKDGSR